MGKNLKTQTTFRLTYDELDLLDRQAEKHGGKGAALVGGLRLLDQRTVDLRAVPSAELLAEIERRLR